MHHIVSPDFIDWSKQYTKCSILVNDNSFSLLHLVCVCVCVCFWINDGREICWKSKVWCFCFQLMITGHRCKFNFMDAFWFYVFTHYYDMISVIPCSIITFGHHGLRWWCHVVTQVQISTASDNGLVSGGTKPLPESIVTQRDPQEYAWMKFQRLYMGFHS